MAMDEALTCQAGAHEAHDFERLFLSQFARLARLARRVVADAADAEDLAADVLWKCFRKRPAAINLEGWLSRAVVRAALDSLRRRARRARYEALWRFLPSPPAPDELLERDDEGQRVRAVLLAIKPRFATLLALRTEGLDYREIADALGVRAGSVGTLLSRAEASFRKEYLRRHGPR